MMVNKSVPLRLRVALLPIRVHPGDPWLLLPLFFWLLPLCLRASVVNGFEFPPALAYN